MNTCACVCVVNVYICISVYMYMRVYVEACTCTYPLLLIPYHPSLTFNPTQDCWSYLRKHQVPYHPLHDAGFSSLGDMHSTKKVILMIVVMWKGFCFGCD